MHTTVPHDMPCHPDFVYPYIPFLNITYARTCTLVQVLVEEAKHSGKGFAHGKYVHVYTCTMNHNCVNSLIVHK